jgi:tRNA A-37 threonylcarbamoyl transferase component Bud32
VGTVVGNYRVEAKIGEGGMGAVYLAHHPLLGRKAAIKILLPEHSKRPDLVTRFFNEAKTAASLRHPALVEVFDFGFLPDGAGYLVMDFLEGQSLQGRLEKVKKLSPEAAADIGRQIAAGVAAAHGQGIVHRDLKPDNVFLVPDPENPGRERVKILDFGIAKLVLPAAGSSQAGVKDLRTSTGMLLGTPLFMAPEQCRGSGQIDHRADIYSVGCILYMMLTGRPPFNHEGVGEVLAAHLHEAVTPPRTIEPSLPAALEAIVLRALDKKPEARFQSMAELAAELQPFLAPQVGGPGWVSRQMAAPPDSAEVPARAGRGGLIGVVAVVAVLGAGGVFFWRQSRLVRPPAPPAVAVNPGQTAPPASEKPVTGGGPAANPTAPAGTETTTAEAAVKPTETPAEKPTETTAGSTEADPPPATATAAEEEEPAAGTTAPPEKPAAGGDEPKEAGGRAAVARPHPAAVTRGRAHYKRAMNHRTRGEEDQALLAFRAALAAGGLGPEEKADAERQSIALRRKFGEVEVMCDVADAIVTIDGRQVGRTPLRAPILVKPGKHHLLITRGGYRAINRMFEVGPGGRLPLRFSVTR